MGSGYTYRCSRCGKEYATQLGIGYMFSTFYKDQIDAIRNGLYGPEWQRLFQENDGVALDAENKAYVCNECGNWQVEIDGSLYVPNDDSYKNDSGYVMSFDLEEKYHLLKRKEHKCQKCGSVMREATDEELPMLPCPDCGGKPVENDPFAARILWD